MCLVVQRARQGRMEDCQKGLCCNAPDPGDGEDPGKIEHVLYCRCLWSCIPLHGGSMQLEQY